jgi:ATP-binding cassette subfamily C (CFTR/MRP) protein 1
VFNQSIAQFIDGWVSLETSLGAIARLRQLQSDVQPEEKGDEAALYPPEDWPFKGRVEIRGLEASYR